MSDYLDLYDYRTRVAAMYRERDQSILSREDPVTVWQRFRAVRDDLFAHHPQSAFDEEQREVPQRPDSAQGQARRKRAPILL